jgi:hypothetical protein
VDSIKLKFTLVLHIGQPDKIIVVKPDKIIVAEQSLDERIANQAGMLTLMNSATGSQNAFLCEYAEQHPTLVHRIVIAADAKPEIRAMLDQNNISERTLYPGLPGLCAWLKRYYAKAW